MCSCLPELAQRLPACPQPLSLSLITRAETSALLVLDSDPLHEADVAPAQRRLHRRLIVPGLGERGAARVAAER